MFLDNVNLCFSFNFNPCFPGFSHVIPYFGTVFLVLLLLDRERLDNEDCRRKYGKDWNKYCNIVKYRIVPGVYWGLHDRCCVWNIKDLLIAVLYGELRTYVFLFCLAYRGLTYSCFVRRTHDIPIAVLYDVLRTYL